MAPRRGDGGVSTPAVIPLRQRFALPPPLAGEDRYSRQLQMKALATRQAARLVAGGAALLAGAVLADASMEHYRGSFDNRAMPVPLAGSALALGTDTALALSGSVGPALAPLAMSVHAASAALGHNPRARLKGATRR